MFSFQQQKSVELDFKYEEKFQIRFSPNFMGRKKSCCCCPPSLVRYFLDPIFFGIVYDLVWSWKAIEWRLDLRSLMEREVSLCRRLGWKICRFRWVWMRPWRIGQRGWLTGSGYPWRRGHVPRFGHVWQMRCCMAYWRRDHPGIYGRGCTYYIWGKTCIISWWWRSNFIAFGCRKAGILRGIFSSSTG